MIIAWRIRAYTFTSVQTNKVLSDSQSGGFFPEDFSNELNRWTFF